MFDEDLSADSLNKFHSFLSNYLEELKTKLGEIDKNVEVRKLFNDLSRTKKPTKFIAHYDQLINFDPSFQGALDLLKYLYENNALEVEQATEAVDSILNSESVSNVLNNVINKMTRKTYELEIEKCEKILSFGSISIDELLEMLEKSDLTEEDILMVLAYEAYKTTNYKKEMNSSEIIEIEDKEKDINQEKEAVLLELLNIITSNHKLISTLSQSQIEVYKRILELNKEDENILNSFSSKKELCIAYILRLIDINNQLQEENDEELIEILCEDARKDIDKLNEYLVSYKLMVDDEFKEASSVYFLPSLIYELEKIQDKEVLAQLYFGLKNGIYDYIVGKKHSLIQQNVRKDLNVFVNKKGSKAISYLRVKPENGDESKVLIVNYDDVNDIYNSTINMLSNPSNSYMIDECIRHIKENDEMLNPSNEELWQALRDIQQGSKKL